MYYPFDKCLYYDGEWRVVHKGASLVFYNSAWIKLSDLP